MYSEGGDLLETYEGHSDVPKEFVWRTRGGDDQQYDDRQFQLVSWGRDRVLRTFPVSVETMNKAGHIRGMPIEVRVTRRHYESISFKTDVSPDQDRLKETLSCSASPGDRGMTSAGTGKRRQRQGLASSWKKSGESLGASPLSDPIYLSDKSNPPSWKAKALTTSSTPRPAFMTRTRTQPGKLQKTMAWMESVNAQAERPKSTAAKEASVQPVVPLQHRLKDEFTATHKNFSGRILFEKVGRLK
jgi:hypothetical protein